MTPTTPLGLMEAVAFLDRLRGYLERVERAPEGLLVMRADIAAHLRHFAGAVDFLRAPASPRGQAAADIAAQQSHRSPDLLELHEEHIRTARDSLLVFVEEACERITETLAPRSQAELTQLINIAINWLLWGGDEQTSGSRGLDDEVGEIVGQIRAEEKRRRDDWESPSRYAAEIRAVHRKRPDLHTLTRGGAAFLELSGIDAARWLLALESAQSLGPADDWRISAEVAAQLVAEPERIIDLDELEDGSWRFSLKTIRRLAAMKLLHYQGQDLRRGRHNFTYSVFDHARVLLEEIAEQRPTPFAALADALLRDEAAHTIRQTRPSAEQVAHASAAAAFELQAGMVVHEIRNALIPAQVAFSSIDTEIAATRPELLSSARRRVVAGIERALTFAQDMLRVATLGMDPVSSFDAAIAVRDAIASIATELNGSLRYTPPARSFEVVGVRQSFVLMITNLLRNAVQAVTGRTDGVVAVTVEQSDDAVAIRVDDNGAGVPADYRRKVFEPGVALRSGGSGQGLALVWQVVVEALHGSVVCEDSPLGGARFEIRIPMKGARAP